MTKLPISAIVVGLNESHLLAKCLSSLDFVNQLVYVDLGSIDNSLSIAKRFTDEIESHAIVPCAEYIQAKMVPLLKYDWVLYIDPDEYLDPALADFIRNNFHYYEQSNDIASVNVPWQFYFINHRLIGTPWGGENKKPILVNRNRFLFEPKIHVGRRNITGFKSHDVSNSNDLLLHHYWVQGWSSFLGKHLRYLKKEGKVRFDQGRKSSISKILRVSFIEFKYSYFICKGYRDGYLGILLSLFWMFYQLMAEIALYRCQILHKRNLGLKHD
jgi:hypothetical protein